MCLIWCDFYWDCLPTLLTFVDILLLRNPIEMITQSSRKFVHFIRLSRAAQQPEQEEEAQTLVFVGEMVIKSTVQNTVCKSLTKQLAFKAHFFLREEVVTTFCKYLFQKRKEKAPTFKYYALA